MRLVSCHQHPYSELSSARNDVCFTHQVFKMLRGGVHPIAVREFRYALSGEEQQQLLRLVSKLTRCSAPHVVKLLGFARIPGTEHCTLVRPLETLQLVPAEDYCTDADVAVQLPSWAVGPMIWPGV